MGIRVSSREMILLMRAFTLASVGTQNRMVYLQDFGASLSFVYEVSVLFTAPSFLDLDNIAIRGIPGAGSHRSYVIFVVLRRLQSR